MENAFKVGLLGLTITVLGVFTLNDESSPTSLQGAGYKQNNDEHSENSCGNGILPENIPCKNLAKGEKNNVNIKGIVFP